MLRSLDIFITNLDKKYIKDKNTGEVSNWTMVTYLIAKEETNKSKGCAQLTCYVSESAFTELDKFMYKWTKAQVKDVVEDNRIKLKIKSVNDVVVS